MPRPWPWPARDGHRAHALPGASRPGRPARYRPAPPRTGRPAPARRLLALVGAVLLAVLAVQVPTAAGAAPRTGSPVQVQRLCGAPKPGDYACFAMRRTDVPTTLGLRPRGATGAAAQAGYSPADLRAAYGLPADDDADAGGAGATIAIVDAYDDPSAEADLAVYRKQYGLPDCTTENGCFRKVDERGGTDYPAQDPDWAGEISLDVDMVSAIAPRAHILLVEADQPSSQDLGTAVNTAVALGAKYVSNSWGAYDDEAGNRAFDEAYFNHPGTAIVASSGDAGYGVSYPAASPYVTAVGGTSLHRDDAAGRGWSESVWNSVSSNGIWGAPGSGCSAAEPKPEFQTDRECPGRAVADVSAVADPATGVAVYNSFSDGGWNVYGGTSASAPIIAGTYALAGTPARDTYPNAYPYLSPGALNDVTSGDNASCAPGVDCGFGTAPDCTPAYACAAGPGYDGPTGLREARRGRDAGPGRLPRDERPGRRFPAGGAGGRVSASGQRVRVRGGGPRHGRRGRRRDADA